MRQLEMSLEGLDVEKMRGEILQKIIMWQRFLKLENVDLNNKKIAYELTALTSMLRLSEYTLAEAITPIVLLALYVLMLSLSYNTQIRINFSTYLFSLSSAVKLASISENSTKTSVTLASDLWYHSIQPYKL